VKLGVGPFLVPLCLSILALLLCDPAAANISRDDTYLVQSTGQMQINEIFSYAGTDAFDEKNRSDADQDHAVSAAEVDAYLANTTSSRVGNSTAYIRWDGTPAVWVDLTAAASGLQGKVDQKRFTLTLDGLLNFSSVAAANHTFTISSPAAVVWSFSFTLPSNWSIQNVTGVSVVAQSQNTLSGTVNATLAVIQVAESSPPPPPPPFNDTTPPVLNPGAERTVTAGVLTVFEGAAADNDPAFPTGAAFWWTFQYNGTPMNFSGLSFSYTLWALGTYELTFSGTDASGNRAEVTARVTVVSPDQVAPVVVAGADRNVTAGTPADFAGNATDNDPQFPVGATIAWTFEYNGSTMTVQGETLSFTFWSLGTHTLHFFAVDAWGNRGEATLNVTVESPDQQAPTVDPGSDLEVTAGANVSLQGAASDDDPFFQESAVFWWTFHYDDRTENLSGRNASFQFDVPGTYIVTFSARDPWGNVGSRNRTIVVLAAGPSGPSAPPATAGSAADLVLPGLMAALLLASFVTFAAARRRRAGAPPGPVAQVAAAGSAEVLPGAAAAVGPSRPAYVVEGLLLLYKDGRLIHHQAAGPQTTFEDPEVVGSMFSAVSEFVRDSFRGEEGALSRLTYGQNTILVDRSPHLFGAAIVYGEPDTALRDDLEHALGRIELAYAGVVERWDGDRASFRGIERFVAPVFAATAGLTRADVRAAAGDKAVKLLSGTEHYKGYLRLRLAVVNHTDERITDARVTVDINRTVLRLARIEPAGIPHEGLRAQVGDIAPGERVGAIYYLDPQTCSDTNIQGFVTFRDGAGGLHSVAMKPRTAEIVCPLFFTPHHANIATMKRLVETSLSARDSKLYRVTALPNETSFKDLAAITREAVQRHHVLLVRNIARHTPFEAKAWFYGQTKVSKSPVIIRVVVAMDKRTVEFFVATDAPPVLTGLLAEFHRSFTEMLGQRAPGVKIEPVLDDALKGLLTPDEFTAAEGANEPEA
jgi:hypothetical protein